MIDLRSDTVTAPCEAMREEMARAAVGDDQFGEDPSVNHLQERVAALLGKEAALWLPTGTMANQVALRTLTRPGDDVIVSAGAHVVWSETGAGAANAGVQFTELGGATGYFDAAAFAAAIKPRGHVILPPTTLLTFENTHNRAGGVVVPLEIMASVCDVAAEIGISTYLDGARLWNAAVAAGQDVDRLAASFDLVWVAFSKGLGAPGGSMLAGPAELIARASRYRRMLGGAMRQVGIFAAAADHALDHHLDDLAADHANARAVAEILAASSAIRLDPNDVETNIVIFRLAPDAGAVQEVVDRAGAAGVAVFALGDAIRVVTHRDVTTEECLEAARLLVEAAEG
ncbi:MAG TPA: threonine aldolase family protein [Acidimicrobiia bacterium]|nr:threonine aldolase family protein [Acidimicrobiia bacterium]